MCQLTIQSRVHTNTFDSLNIFAEAEAHAGAVEDAVDDVLTTTDATGAFRDSSDVRCSSSMLTLIGWRP